MKLSKKTYNALLFVLLVAVVMSCSPVKFVPGESYLLNKAGIEVEGKVVNREEVSAYLRQKGNLRILGFLKFHLWLYNLSSKKKGNDWLKRIGEEPVIYDDIMTQRSNSQVKQFFRNKGYYYSQVGNEIDINERKRKVNIKYIIDPGEPYRIRNINYHINDSALRSIFYSDTTIKAISRGMLFDVDLLEEERNRIATLFKNYGYYDFGKEIIYYMADTNLYSHEVDIDMHLKESSVPLKPYQIGRVSITFGRGGVLQPGQASGSEEAADTLFKGRYTFISDNRFKYNPDLFMRLNSLKSGELYGLDKVKQTFNAYSGLNQFQFVNIRFRKDTLEDDDDLLNCYINLMPMSKQSVSLDIEGTNTSGNLGVAGNLNYQHRNLFRNAEIFRVSLRGAMERQQWMVENVSNNFNTREMGVEASLSVPRLIGPGNWFRYFDRYLPQTVLTMGYNYQDRPDYTRTITNIKAGYNWKTTKLLWHNLNLVDFNMVNLYSFEPEFINSIKDLYIKSSFTDHLIFATNYSLVYNTQQSNIRENYRYVKFTFESAGNTLNLLSKITGSQKSESIDSLGIATSSYYKIFDTRYAQYVKADLEIRYGYILDKYNSIVGRAFAGIGLPYGNFDVLPFEKKYFTGGANGIRAWQVRSLGPGTYEAPPEAYPNQSSDIKLEVNLEYRFRLVRMLEGALFLDAGNIWAINDKDNREGAKFKFGNFYKQIAIGTGTGFRFDFNYFIFRLDVGMKLRDPSQELANGWIIGNRKLNNNDFNVSFAIGYPF